MTFANSSSQFVPDDQLSAGLPLDGATANPLLPETAAGQGGSSVDAILQEGVRRAHGSMVAFGQREDFEALMAVPFGASYDVAAGEQFFDSLVMGTGVLPQVEVLDDSILGGAFGAYAQATDTVYMSRQFLETGNVDAITGVLLEEYGHGVDARVNAIDSLGDEGEIFSHLIRERQLDGASLDRLYVEDDYSTLEIHGMVFDVENHSSSADFNNDGQSDVLWRHASGLVHTWLLDGTNVVGRVNLESPDSSWQIQGMGDFNNDGQSDVLWRHASGLVHTWLMDGTNVVGRVNLESPDTSWQIQGTGDFNNDGQSDVLWRHASGLVHTWLMDGTNVVGRVNLESPDTSWQISLGPRNSVGTQKQPAPDGLKSTTARLQELQSGSKLGERFDFDGLYFGECVDLVKYATNSRVTTTNWRKGESVIENGNVAAGTAIATFNGAGDSYNTPGYTRQHTSIFSHYGHDASGNINGFWAWSQNYPLGNGVSLDFFKTDGSYSANSDADYYYVINV